MSTVSESKAPTAAAGLAKDPLIVVDRDGPSLPAFGDEPAFRLDLASLRQLVALAGASGATAVDPDLEAALRSRQLLGDPVPVAPRPDRGAPPSSDAESAYDGMYVMVVPVPLRVTGSGFELLDHEAASIVRLDPLELCAATAFCKPATMDDGHLTHAIVHGEDALAKDRFVELARRLEAAGLIGRAGMDGEDTVEGKFVREFRVALGQSMRRGVVVDAALAEQRAASREDEARTGRRRVEVVPVTDGDVPLLSLGLVMSYAMALDGGRLLDSYTFIADWMNRTVPSLTGDEAPAVFAFSNYLWSHQSNLASSAAVKASNPRHVTVHGGPDSPKYEGDVEAYFRENPHVDVAVHGEGEETFAEMLDALAPSMLAGEPDLTALAGVAGLSYRGPDGVVRTAARDRIADLDAVPSPYLNGLFDSVGTEGLPYVIIETNRGCPYGCTYCDWGSATLSRIRKFDLDRVFAELDWAARHGVKTIWNADANFGVFARDVDIARQVVDLKREHGFPELLGANYAKNTVKHLRQIVDTLVEGGILATGVLSMQSADDETLLTIRRQNIKVDRYDDLAEEFNRNELPLVTELMMGLPGSTLTSVRNDLQQCIDREMRARMYPTELLVNSPMNDPEYREEHQIQTLHPIDATWQPTARGQRTAPLVVATKTFTRDDYLQMDRFRHHFFLFENYGVLRQVSRFVRQETGLREMDFYRQLEDDTTDRSRWPALSFTFRSMANHLLPPLSWRLFIDEVGAYLTGELGIEDGSALRTVLAVQHALLPARDRRYPYTIDLEHDYPAWHRQMMGLKLGGHSKDWVEHAPRLATLPPMTGFEVTDPQSVSRDAMGVGLLSANEADWEMRSPVGRTLTFFQTLTPA